MWPACEWLPSARTRETGCCFSLRGSWQFFDRFELMKLPWPPQSINTLVGLHSSFSGSLNSTSMQASGEYLGSSFTSGVNGLGAGMVIGRNFTDRYPLGMLCAGYRHRSVAVGWEPRPTRGRYRDLISYRFSRRYELSPIPIMSRRFQTSAIPCRYLPILLVRDGFDWSR